MAFADRLAQDGLCVGFYMRVRGLPLILANFEAPEAWETSPGSGLVSLGGETYTWWARLDTLASGLGAVEVKSSPKQGYAISGAMSFRILVTGHEGDPTADQWLQQMATSRNRVGGAKATLSSDLEPAGVSGTNPQVYSTSRFSGVPDYLYAGLETLKPTAMSATGFTVAAGGRGRFGSQAIHHAAPSYGDTERGYGATLYDYPMAIKGRPVDLWMATGALDVEGEFSPYGASIASSEDGKIFAGVVTDHGYDSDLLRGKLETASLDQLTKRMVGARLPRATLGFTDNLHTQYIPINETNRWVWFRLWQRTAVDAGPNPGDVAAIRMIRDDGTGGTEEVPDGIYTVPQVNAYLKTTLESHADIDYAHGVTLAVDEASGNVWTVWIQIGTASGNYWDLQLLMDREGESGSQRGSFWKQLGFVEDSDLILSSSNTGTHNYFRFLAKEQACELYVAESRYGNPWIPYRAQEPGSEPFNAAPGWTDDTGAAIKGFLRIGDHEVVEFDTVGSSGPLRWLQVSARDRLGSFGREAVYIESEPRGSGSIPKRIEGVQGVVITNTTRGRAAGVLGVSGSGYPAHNHTLDQGWRGSGINLPSDLIDVDAFVDWGELRGSRVDWIATFEPVEYRELFADDFVLEQASIVSDGGVITITEARHPWQTQRDGAIAIDHTMVWSTSPAGVGVDASHSKCINTIRWQAAYDHGTGKYFIQKSVTRDVVSIADIGEQDTIDIELKSVGPKEDAYAELWDLGGSLFTQYAWPYLIIELDFGATPEPWSWPLGSIIELTHTGIPGLEDAGRGQTSLLCRLAARRAYFVDGGSVFARLTLVTTEGRLSEWSPGMRMTRVSDTSWTAADHAFSDSTAAEVDDWAKFDADEWIYMYEEGDEGNREKVQISAIASGTVTLYGPGCTLTGPCIAEKLDHDDADVTDAALDYGYMSDTDGLLDLDGGSTREAFEYGA